MYSAIANRQQDVFPVSALRQVCCIFLGEMSAPDWRIGGFAGGIIVRGVSLPQESVLRENNHYIL
jgi:hypothetical protein